MAATWEVQGVTYIGAALPSFFTIDQYETDLLVTDIWCIPLPAIADRNTGD
ncbi:hypothetical protein D3C72_2003640 [compost metagenome]